MKIKPFFFIHLLQRQNNEKQSEDHFKDFDQVDDARCAIDENEVSPFNNDDDVRSILQTSELNHASRDLLQRLLEKNPQHRLKSLLALQRIAVFHNYSFDDVRHMKVNS
jgi:serine/threonine protein kinase